MLLSAALAVFGIASSYAAGSVTLKNIQLCDENTGLLPIDFSFGPCVSISGNECSVKTGAIQDMMVAFEDIGGTQHNYQLEISSDVHGKVMSKTIDLPATAISCSESTCVMNQKIPVRMDHPKGLFDVKFRVICAEEGKFVACGSMVINHL